MTLGTGARKTLLTIHVAASVGWLGAVIAFLAVAVVGLRVGDDAEMRAAYPAMDVIGWVVIVPLCFLSLVTGVVQGLATTWGLFRHYWVLIKLLITALSTLILMVHMQPISEMARLAADPGVSLADAAPVRLQLVVDAGAAIVALLVTTVLSVVKPRGVTRYGQRKLREEAATS